ncbi:MAG: amino acid ABC transporter permease [Candidatus Ancillula sp.]|nr:amino acid ABC transporter permease [Candidatus Ancillula sp.]
MDFEYISGSVPLFVEAGLLVLRLALFGITGSLTLGLLVAVFRFYKFNILAQVSGIYIELSRNIPLVILLFFMLFGLNGLGITITPEACAVGGMVFIGGGYMAEAFRTGFQHVCRTQVEAGKSLGMTAPRIFVSVIFPQSIRNSFPLLGANLIFLLKETSVFSAVSLVDLMYQAKMLIGQDFKTAEVLTLLITAYGLILIPVAICITIVDKRLRRAYGTV